VAIEERVGADVLEGLARRGHRLDIVPEMHLNTMAAMVDQPQGVLRAGICSTGEMAYALGW
jgi:hypothetical protein